MQVSTYAALALWIPHGDSNLAAAFSTPASFQGRFSTTNMHPRQQQIITNMVRVSKETLNEINFDKDEDLVLARGDMPVARGDMPVISNYRLHVAN